MVGKSCLFLVILLSISSLSTAEQPGPPVKQPAPYVDLVKDMRAAGLIGMDAYSMLAQLTALGPRLGGSPGAERAVEFTRELMLKNGFENVHLEEVTVRRWERGPQETAVLASGTGKEQTTLSIAALGGSVATPEEGLTAGVIEVKSLEEADKLGDRAKGKIIFFNRPMDPTHLNTFDAYGGAADQRVHGASRGAKVGAVAVLVRSLTMLPDDNPHTGVMKYAEGVPKIPTAALGIKSAELLSRRLQSDPDATVTIKMECRDLGDVVSHNVVGQLTGTELPAEVVVLGGHLDAWDLGPGAHDDGAGCIQSIEALRIIQSLGLKPRRTIRAVMFMDEEFGGTGGRAYAGDQKRKKEKHIAAIESDRGGFIPLGFNVRGDDGKVASVARWLPSLEEAGIVWVKHGYGGVDINPLHDTGTLTIGLVPDSQRYFDVHHSANDVMETVNPRELELGAVAMAALAYILSEEGVE